MTSQNQRKRLGGAGNHRVVGSVSDLVARGCGAAGSGPSGESSKCPKSFRVGTLNVGTMKQKASEVVETVSRRRVDLCCLQKTRWKMEGVKQIVGKDSSFKLFCWQIKEIMGWSAWEWQKEARYGFCWPSEPFWVERTPSRKTCQKAQPSVEENRALKWIWWWWWWWWVESEWCWSLTSQLGYVGSDQVTGSFWSGLVRLHLIP